MHRKRHDASGDDIILYVRIPCCPEAFEEVKMHVVFGYFFELTPICILRREKGGGGVPAEMIRLILAQSIFSNSAYIMIIGYPGLKKSRKRGAGDE